MPDLREQVNRAIEPSLAAAHHYGANTQQRDAATERVLAVFAERERDAYRRGTAAIDQRSYERGREAGADEAARESAERERLLRERIEALPSEAEGPGADSVLLQDVLAVFDG